MAEFRSLLLILSIAREVSIAITYKGGRDKLSWRPEALQSMLIIPRSPSALARDERPVNDLTLEELRAFVETARNQTVCLLPCLQDYELITNLVYQRATVNREGKVKNEAGDKAERNSGGKRKREVETMTARGNRPVEMIDLSGDD